MIMTHKVFAQCFFFIMYFSLVLSVYPRGGVRRYQKHYVFISLNVDENVHCNLYSSDGFVFLSLTDYFIL